MPLVCTIVASDGGAGVVPESAERDRGGESALLPEHAQTAVEQLEGEHMHVLDGGEGIQRVQGVEGGLPEGHRGGDDLAFHYDYLCLYHLATPPLYNQIMLHNNIKLDILSPFLTQHQGRNYSQSTYFHNL